MLMDHEAASAFPSVNASAAFNLAEIWQFPLSGGGGGAHFAGIRGFLVEESTVTEQNGRTGGGEAGRRRRDAAAAAHSEDESSKLASTSSGNELNESDAKRSKPSESREENGDANNNNKQGEQSFQPTEPPKQDYIHVRARRGQATDSHSLAERARREKISERMKILQDLVPGCNKVIGKAMVLDEIINYIQSLQRQVEFLSMKLEAVNSRVNPSFESFPSKEVIGIRYLPCIKDFIANFSRYRTLLFLGCTSDCCGFIPLTESQPLFGVQAFDAAGMAFNSQGAREYGQGSPHEWLHMQVGGNFERAP
ncbi:hypothetical protein Syun_023870 [Stephania yunnanensis]|uniref:BHLH domain-containing protein n=2 Tax=Magnoliopsida TaxID=3398 RepID=A0AAP0FQH6_9MAGN